ncbi:uncharacterized protein [Fopius arisanus]|uniref:Uncharacterized protein n=1 Tax=Fopius arisanus TaxID=64838 RepID=A0A9R1TEQ8_9HYME|nr:PREDICTED: uncharacterized protein LOC105269328 [Fopius arisanus]
MASGFIILLLIAVAIVPEVRPGSTPPCAMILIDNRPPKVGALVTPNRVLAAAANFSPSLDSVTVQVGCRRPTLCRTPPSKVVNYMIDVPSNIVALTIEHDPQLRTPIQPTPIGPPGGYSDELCSFTRLEQFPRWICWKSVLVHSPEECGTSGMNVPPGHACFTSRYSEEIIDDDVGGLIICNDHLIGIMTGYDERQNELSAQIMYDFTQPGAFH